MKKTQNKLASISIHLRAASFYERMIRTDVEALPIRYQSDVKEFHWFKISNEIIISHGRHQVWEVWKTAIKCFHFN